MIYLSLSIYLQNIMSLISFWSLCVQGSSISTLRWTIWLLPLFLGNPKISLHSWRYLFTRPPELTWHVRVMSNISIDRLKPNLTVLKTCFIHLHLHLLHHFHFSSPITLIKFINKNSETNNKKLIKKNWNFKEQVLQLNQIVTNAHKPLIYYHQGH